MRLITGVTIIDTPLDWAEGTRFDPAFSAHCRDISGNHVSMTNEVLQTEYIQGRIFKKYKIIDEILPPDYPDNIKETILCVGVSSEAKEILGDMDEVFEKQEYLIEKYQTQLTAHEHTQAKLKKQLANQEACVEAYTTSGFWQKIYWAFAFHWSNNHGT